VSLRAALLTPLLALGLAGCGFGADNVTRVYSGHEVAGPYITPEAYAHYAQGILDERAGQLGKAEREYQAALLEDDSSPDLWARLGAVECRSGKDPSRSFAQAESLDASFAPLFRERARCALTKGDARGALTAAERAVALDPDDEDASLLVARAYVKLGRAADARRWLLALLLRDPTSTGAREAHREVAPGTEPAPALPPDPFGARRPGERRATRAGVDRALAQGDDASARRLAKSAGIGPGELALRAAALGRAQLAKAEAERVLAADADDSDALVAALTAASLEGDRAAFETALSGFGPEPLDPSPLAVRLLGELLARRVGPDSAETWRRAWALPAAADPLEASVEARAQR